MPEEKERPRPHGDPLRDEIADNREDDAAQRQSDAPADLTDAAPAPAKDDGEKRRKQYKNGATPVSRID